MILYISGARGEWNRGTSRWRHFRINESPCLSLSAGRLWLVTLYLIDFPVKHPSRLDYTIQPINRPKDRLLGASGASESKRSSVSRARELEHHRRRSAGQFHAMSNGILNSAADPDLQHLSAKWLSNEWLPFISGGTVKERLHPPRPSRRAGSSGADSLAPFMRPVRVRDGR